MEGRAVSHYRIVQKLGGGGMGIAYKAEGLRLKRMVALKFLPPERTGDAEAKQRLMQEAQAASALDHPNICTVHEIDETPDGQLFLAMAYHAGETLKNRIDRGPLEIGEAIDIGIQIAQGLARAHEAGIAPRVRVPVLMLNGQHDIVCPLERRRNRCSICSARLRRISATTQRNEVIKETLDWMDRYLGPVR
jgi:hypothetical protein